MQSFDVALRKESVDRNLLFRAAVGSLIMVALRKESVDRNDTVQVVIVIVYASLSARRAWIEMIVIINLGLLLSVALRKESVDRNDLGAHGEHVLFSRSPQGERG